MSQGKRITFFAVAMLACMLAAVLLITLTGATAANAQASTSTQIFTDVTQSLPFANPCTGAPGTATITISGVMHLTSGPLAGTVQVSGNETGNGVLTPSDPALPSYRGQFTSHFDTNTNLDNGTATSTLNIHAGGSDGSLLNFHQVEHITINATGMIISFDHPTCG
jgi:hypothetical protein